MDFEFCPFKGLSRDTWWRHDVFKTTTQNFNEGSTYLSSMKKIKVCSMAKVPSTKTMCFVYGIFWHKKKKKQKKKSEQQQ